MIDSNSTKSSLTKLENYFKENNMKDYCSVVEDQKEDGYRIFISDNDCSFVPMHFVGILESLDFNVLSYTKTISEKIKYEYFVKLV